MILCERTDLHSIRISDPLCVNPILRLLVLRIVNLLLRVDGRSEILEEVAEVVAIAIEEHVVGVVGEHVERVEVGGLAKVGLGGKLEVLLLKLASHRVLVAEDEVNLRERVIHVSKRHTDTNSSA